MNYFMTEPYIIKCKNLMRRHITRYECTSCDNYKIGCKFNLRSYNQDGELLIIRIKNNDRKWAVQNLQSQDRLTRIVAGVIVNEI